MSNRLKTCAKVALGLGVLLWTSIFVVSVSTRRDEFLLQHYGGYCHSERELAASLDHCEVLLTVFDCPGNDGEGITYLIAPQDLSNRSFSNALCV